MPPRLEIVNPAPCISLGLSFPSRALAEVCANSVASSIKDFCSTFIMKAVIQALQSYPRFNASLDESGENLIIKKYFNLGIAMDTPNGLVVP
jgi:hypothetical protein